MSAALYFGDSESPLLGMWSQPTGSDRDHGVLLCPPIGQEHVRSHWALRQLAATLNRSGFHCFRFDWFGVGDSSGALRDASLARWQADLSDAVQELRDTAGVERVSLVGLRMGATLAALAPSRLRATCLVLWDPIVIGNRYTGQLATLTQRLLADDRVRYWNPAPRQPRPGELVGCDFGAQLLAELAAVDLRTSSPPSCATCLVRSGAEPEVSEYADRLRAHRTAVEVHDTELRSEWNNPDQIEQLLLPGDALRTIATYLESRA